MSQGRLIVACDLGTTTFRALVTEINEDGELDVEVFAIGVIVSLVKLAAMARVELGLSFWAYLAFSGLFLLAFSSMDRLTVWSSIERIRGGVPA